MSPIYCENFDMLAHHWGLIYTQARRVGTLESPSRCCSSCCCCCLAVHCTTIFV